MIHLPDGARPREKSKGEFYFGWIRFSVPAAVFPFPFSTYAKRLPGDSVPSFLEVESSSGSSFSLCVCMVLLSKVSRGREMHPRSNCDGSRFGFFRLIAKIRLEWP